MVYKHAISTVVPARMVKIPALNPGEEAADDASDEPGNEA
jgi:hypothetical protein